MGEHARKTWPQRAGEAGPTMLPDKRMLLDLLRHAFDQLPGAPCIRIEAPVPAVDARAWLAAQDAPVRTYWRSRDGLTETAAVGAADTVTLAGSEGGADFSAVLATLRERLSCAHPDMRYFGGWAFDPAGSVEAAWSRFGVSRFVLPRFEIHIKEGRPVFACNACRADASPAKLAAIGAQFDRLKGVAPGASRPDVPPVIARDDVPRRAAWEGLVERALEAIGGGKFEKVVLARQVRLHLAAPPDASVLIERLAQHADNAYLFLVQPARNVAFVGATPERLCRTLGGYVKTEALAGTRPRGSSAAADASLSDELIHSAKELREHAFVADRLRDVLGRACSEVRTEPELSLIRLHRCQHLVRRFEGILAGGCSDAHILAALHPTPAVGGHPDAPALAWLRENEPFGRGWYAGPVGWVGHDASEFAMGIRSGLVNGKTLTLYSGAGIVAGSAPGAEWDETESKLAAFLDVLTQNDLRTR